MEWERAGDNTVSTEDDKIRIRLAEIMSSGGLGYNQISLEILYLLPMEFVQRYIWLWEKALGPAGGGDARGQQMDRDATLGKAQTRTDKKGTVPGAGGGGQAKKWKKVGMSVRDEHALALKSRVDRRLRAIGRDIREFEMLEGSAREKAKAVEIVKCRSCGKIMDQSWICCPFDGTPIASGR
jgi:hypothetical protein